MTVHVYSGPTLSGEEVTRARPDAVVHPPIEHGDLLGLDVGTDDTVVIIDGLYHQRAPVRHKEVLALIDRGVAVVGTSSMGALRAAELADVGMIGSGEVFEMYRRGDIDADDEVAVTHLPATHFEARNVPLVNVRFAVVNTRDAGLITDDQADRIVAAALGLHYTERTWRNIRSALSRPEDDHAMTEMVEFVRERPELMDLKRLDALRTLTSLERIVTEAGPAPELGHWQNPHCYNWGPEFSGADDAPEALASANGGITQHQETETADESQPDRVSDAEVLRYRQVYEPDFVQLWQRHVLLAASAHPGITAGADTPGRLASEMFELTGAREDVLSTSNEYVTAEEQASLDPDELMVRTLVRCYVPPRGLHDVLTDLPSTSRVDEIRSVIRAARTLNDQVLWRRQIRLVERLSAQRLERHLEQLWEIPPGRSDRLLAAARDRGFAALSAAVGAVRPYFLYDDNRGGGHAVQRWSAAR